jgi:hypothetical protein
MRGGCTPFVSPGFASSFTSLRTTAAHTHRRPPVEGAVSGHDSGSKIFFKFQKNKEKHWSSYDVEKMPKCVFDLGWRGPQAELSGGCAQ